MWYNDGMKRTFIPMSFYNDCVNWFSRDVPALCEMVDNGIEITRKTFLKYINKLNLQEIEQGLGYDNHFKMSQDYHVSYYKGKLRGRIAVWFVHSSIEYVFR